MTAANYDEVLVAANAAESALELAAHELSRQGNWNEVLTGARTSSLVDGSPGQRSVSPGEVIDLVALTNVLRCGREEGCSAPQISQTTQERPWGANNPHWALFVHTALPAPAMPWSAAPQYVVVWIGDDARETDGDPLDDGAGAGGEGRYIVRARVESFSARGARYAIDAEFARVCTAAEAGETCAPGIRVQSWRSAASAVP